MVMMLSNGSRHGWGRLYLFGNIGTRQQPRLADPVPLCHDDGKPVSCFYRTMITCADWDADGRIDIFLSTEHILNAVTICGNLYDGPPSPSRAAIPKRRARRPIVRVSSHLAKVLPKPQFVTACGIPRRHPTAFPAKASTFTATKARGPNPNSARAHAARRSSMRSSLGTKSSWPSSTLPAIINWTWWRPPTAAAMFSPVPIWRPNRRPFVAAGVRHPGT